jgi:sulfur oxidation c-type cytochrome SoxX
LSQKNRGSSTAPKSRKEAYLERYNATKVGGESFFPETLVRDSLVALAIFVFILCLAIFIPASTELPADPTSTTYNPRPEWYFLFFFQFLKIFPGYLEWLAAVVTPVIALAILFFVPFFDKNPERRWARRKTAIGIGGVILIVFAVLEVGGALSAPTQTVAEVSPLVQKGEQVYRSFNCSYCHAINGVGGAVGPDLSNTATKWNTDNLTAYLKNPNAMIPHTLHPKLLFLPDELDAVVAYLLTLGAEVPYTAQAPVLFDQNCAACHMINGKGGTVGPDLTHVGSRRSFAFIESFTTNPNSVIQGASMPGFKGVLSTEQIEDIAAYLYSLK